MTQFKITPLTWTPARDVLDHEARDFTPWLAQNLELLGDALGVDALTLISTEWKVDTFSLDILAQGVDADGDVTVVIENQYGHTDHSHLGQLLTYAAGAAAEGGRVLAVWLVEEVRPAHLAAVDFLNRISASEEGGFGIVLLRVRFTPSPEGFHVYFEAEAQPNSFIASAPRAQKDSGVVIAEKGEFIEAVDAQLEPLLRGTGLRRAGGVNRKHGAVRYRLPHDIELSRYLTLRVVCSSGRTNLALYIESESTAEGNWAVAEVMRRAYENLVGQYGITIDTWHGSGVSTKRDRIISEVGIGYDGGDAARLGDEAGRVFTAWLQLLREHPLTDVSDQVEALQ